MSQPKEAPGFSRGGACHNAALLSRIEELWRDGSLSMLGIGGKLGVSRSRVAALIARARKQPGGIERLPARPKSESNRLSAQRRRAIKAGASLDEFAWRCPTLAADYDQPTAWAPQRACSMSQSLSLSLE